MVEGLHIYIPNINVYDTGLLTVAVNIDVDSFNIQERARLDVVGSVTLTVGSKFNWTSGAVLSADTPSTTPHLILNSNCSSSIKVSSGISNTSMLSRGTACSSIMLILKILKQEQE
jgi:hypothetical protein